MDSSSMRPEMAWKDLRDNPSELNQYKRRIGSMEKMKLLLIYPESPITEYTDVRLNKFLSKNGGFMSATLGTIAALTPPEFEVSIIDENVDPIDFDIPYDLVGITVFHLHKKRAKEIVGEY
jgi:hypothetical protein